MPKTVLFTFEIFAAMLGDKWKEPTSPSVNPLDYVCSYGHGCVFQLIIRTFFRAYVRAMVQSNMTNGLM